MNWKYTDNNNAVVTRTNADGSVESKSVEAIADWILAGNTPLPADPVITPPITSVTMRQARLALLQAGKLADVDPAIAALPSPQKEAARIEWEYSQTVERNRPFVLAIAPALGLTEAQLNDLFTLAATL